MAAKSKEIQIPVENEVSVPQAAAALQQDARSREEECKRLCEEAMLKTRVVVVGQVVITGGNLQSGLLYSAR